MSIWTRAVAVISTLLLALALGACSTGLTGTVVSATTGAGIPGASVAIGDKSAVTDANGQFVIEGIGRQQQTGTVEVSGFPTAQFEADLSKGGDSVVVEIEDSLITLNLSEAAVEPAALQGVAATLDGVDATGTPLAFPLVPPGEHRLVVTATDHETHETTITVDAGEVSIDVVMSLTPLATYSRFLEAGRFGRDETEYQYIHPDERALLTYEKWVELGSGLTMKSTSLGAVRMLASWASQYTGQTYANVAEVDRSIEYQVTDPQYSDYGMTITDNANQHWVKVDGVWYMVHREKFD